MRLESAGLSGGTVHGSACTGGAELINLDELNQFREAVVTPFLPLREVFSNRKATVRERTEALVHFLEALEMEQKLAAMAQQFEEVAI